MGLTITNNGPTNLDITEFIEKLTTLTQGQTLTVDPDNKKIIIGDIEIDLS